MAHGGDPEAEVNPVLSQLFTRLWDLDANRCKPDVDYCLDLQGYVTTTNLACKDRASRSLFATLDEERVFSRPTYRTFRALLDNYESDAGRAEVVTAAEEAENRAFIDAVVETAEVMKEAQRFLVEQRKAPADVRQFKRMLYDLWFRLYHRLREDGSKNSSGFEHVFVGETRGSQVTGFHNWIQFYLQERRGNIDYRGYFRRGTTEEMEKSPRIVTLQFTWKGDCGKPIGSSFIGTSPEFEVAMYTVTHLMRCQKVVVNIKKYVVELTCHPHGNGIGTAFPMSKSE